MSLERRTTTRRSEDPFSLVPFRGGGFGLWDREFEQMSKRMERLERSLFPDTFSASRGLSTALFNPKVDFKETDASFELVAEFPGLESKDIKIDLDEENRVLTLSGEQKFEKEEKEDETYHYRERSYGSFQRSVTVPDNVNLADIRANMDHGLLRIELPKQEVKVTTKRSIQIGDRNTK